MTVPGTGTATVTLSAGTGSFEDLPGNAKQNSDGSITFSDLKGQGSVKVTYRASSDKDLKQGGTDTLTAIIRTDDGGVVGDPATATIVINPEKGHPLTDD